MSEIKAIETEYNGYRFRSRLEARWAVFFDEANIQYDYEPEGYIRSDNTRMQYLPDFYLKDLDMYVEVKGDTKEGLREILDKCEQSIVWGGPIKQILILSDVPDEISKDNSDWLFPIIYWQHTGVMWGWAFFVDTADSVDIILSHNHHNCDAHYYVLQEGIKAKSKKTVRNERTYPNPFETTGFYNPRVHKALKAARQARFEHGEKPIVERTSFNLEDLFQ